MSTDRQSRPVILAVDDAADTLGMLSTMLEKAGMTTLVAADGNGALSLLNHATPDLILMDAVMPRMDGFETCRAIKRLGKFAHIPIIFMTGLSEPEDVVKGFAVGGVDYVTKPIHAEIMLARIRTHLANARVSQSARQALDASGTPLIASNSNGEVLWITPQGLELLGVDANQSGWRKSLAPLLMRIVENKVSNAPVRETENGDICASLIAVTETGEYLLRLTDAHSPGEEAILKKTLALTERESEVLAWVAKGKSNRDIADILACSPRTINKHLEQIFQKLEVENRTAAAMRAVQVLMQA